MGTLIVFVGCAGLSIGLMAALNGSSKTFHLRSRSQAFALVGAAALTLIAGAAIADPLPTTGSDPAPSIVAPPPPQAITTEPVFEVTADEPSAIPSPPNSDDIPAPRVGARRDSAAPTTGRRALPRVNAAAGPICDPAYPDFCIPPRPPDLDCADIGEKNFTVLSPDPHRFDADGDGLGCDAPVARPPSPPKAPLPPNPPTPPATKACSDGIDNDGDGLVDAADAGCSGADDNNEGGGSPPPPPPPPPVPPAPPVPPSPPGTGCDPSYPNVCIPPAPPDLDCPQIQYTNFSVVGSDPHGFDADNDGIGCEA